MPSVRVIDLFAGPGGLSEGFAGLLDKSGKPLFKIAASAEMERSAHATLSLRALQRLVRLHGDGADGRRFADLVAKLAPSGSLAVAEAAGLFGLGSAWRDVSREVLNIELGSGPGDSALGAALDAGLAGSGPTVLIGGPPCQAYSLAGRVRNLGKVGYRPESDARHFLYRQYLGILSRWRPDVFIMENVKGILSSKVDGASMFPRILDDLAEPDRALGKAGPGGVRYRLLPLVSPAEKSLFGLEASSPSDYVVRAEEHGVPQARHRVILLGLREGGTNSPPGGIQMGCDEPDRSAGEILDDLPKLRSGLNDCPDGDEQWFRTVRSIRDDLVSSCSLDDARLARFLRTLDFTPSLSRTASRYTPGRAKKFVTDWYRRDNARGLVYNHETRTHMTEDLKRYLFCSAYACEYGRSPTSADFPSSLSPQHANWGSGHFADRFRVQIPSRPASTVTSHLGKDGHQFIHWDPAQCRSLTVREAARLQTFPDDYFFAGPRTAQFTQVGNAVPPYLARSIARMVAKHFGCS